MIVARVFSEAGLLFGKEWIGCELNEIELETVTRGIDGP